MSGPYRFACVDLYGAGTRRLLHGTQRRGLVQCPTPTAYPKGTFPLVFTGLTAASVKALPELQIKIWFDKRLGRLASSPSGRVERSHPVAIANARDIATSLNKEGFILVPDHHPDIDYYNHELVGGVYYGHLMERVRNILGASRVHIFQHTVRSHCADSKKPVLFVHSDYSMEGATRIINRLSHPSDCGTPFMSHNELVQYSNEGRFILLHAWKNISSEPLMKHPLALCCANSCNDKEVIAYDLCYPDRTEGVMMMPYHPGQRWCYFPGMTIDELLLFKQYDSASSFVKSINSPEYDKTLEEFTSCYVPHSAFDDGTVDADYAGRESIEFCILALLD